MSWIQQELLPKTEIDLLREEVRELKKRLSNVQGGLFSRQKDTLDELDREREKTEKLADTVNRLTQRLDHYEEALFPELGVMVEAGGVAPGLRFKSIPVSSLMTSSQSCSTGLLLPQK
jgi:uncharacterized coiled-coil protein SlyX